MEIQKFYKEHKAVLIAVSLIVIVGIACFIMFCGQSDNGATVSEIIRNSEQTREHIEGAGKQLESVEQRLEQSQGRIDNVQNTISSSQERVENVVTRNKRSSELVAESIRLSNEARSILEGLPSTNEKGN